MQPHSRMHHLDTSLLQWLIGHRSQMYWASTTNSLEEQLALETKNQVTAGSSADAVEGRMAFLEKRKAQFKGE